MRRSAFAALAAALLATGCGGDEAPAPKPKPPPTLAITKLSSAGGPTWTPGGPSCVEIGSDPAGTIVVEFAVTNFILRPPGACGSLHPCGSAVLLLDGSSVAQSSTTAISLHFAGADASIGAGQHVFRIELRDDSGNPVLDKQQQILFAEVELEVRAAGGCTAGPDAGPDAAPDAASDAAEAGTDAPAEAEAGEAGDATPQDADSDAADAVDAAE